MAEIILGGGESEPAPQPLPVAVVRENALDRYERRIIAVAHWLDRRNIVLRVVLGAPYLVFLMTCFGGVYTACFILYLISLVIYPPLYIWRKLSGNNHTA